MPLIHLLLGSLRSSAELLRGAVDAQLESTLKVDLDLRPLAKHLDDLASVLEADGGKLERARRLHQAFSVVPPAQLLGHLSGLKRDKAELRAAARKGGAVKDSPRKSAAARKNGRLGGRPRADYSKFISDLVGLAKNKTPDPYLPPEFVATVLRQIEYLPIRVRRRVVQAFEAEGLDFRSFCPRPQANPSPQGGLPDQGDQSYSREMGQIEEAAAAILKKVSGTPKASNH